MDLGRTHSIMANFLQAGEGSGLAGMAGMLHYLTFG